MGLVDGVLNSRRLQSITQVLPTPDPRVVMWTMKGAHAGQCGAIKAIGSTEAFGPVLVLPKRILSPNASAAYNKSTGEFVLQADGVTMAIKGASGFRCLALDSGDEWHLVFIQTWILNEVETEPVVVASVRGPNDDERRIVLVVGEWETYERTFSSKELSSLRGATENATAKKAAREFTFVCKESDVSLRISSHPEEAYYIYEGKIEKFLKSFGVEGQPDFAQTAFPVFKAKKGYLLIAAGHIPYRSQDLSISPDSSETRITIKDVVEGVNVPLWVYYDGSNFYGGLSASAPSYVN